MVVMGCDRNGCPNVLCTKSIVDDFYVICDDCYTDLQKVKKTLPPRMMKEEVREAIDAFMQSRAPNAFVDTNEEFDRLVGGNE